jgi:hypothetical protein
MLSDFLRRVKPAEYSVRVLSETTSKKTVQQVKRKRLAAPVKAAASFALVIAALGGGLVATASASTVTSTQAKADVLTNLVCIDGNSDDAGKWDSGSNRYANMGGKSAFSMENIKSTTAVSGAALGGTSAANWSDFGQLDNLLVPGDNPTKGASSVEYVTAYEKYGLEYPRFDAWIPVYADKDYTFKGVNTKNGVYNDQGKIPTSGIHADNADSVESIDTVAPGASALTTTNALSCVALLPSIQAGIANIMTVPSRYISTVALELYGASYGTSISKPDSILYPIGNSINAIITAPGGLKDTLFIPFMIPLILLGAIWVGYVGIIKRAASNALQSTLWMIGAIAAGTIFLAQPTLISSYIDGAVAQTQRVINETVLTSDNDMCSFPNQANIANESTREIKCVVWYSTIYAPWVSGQFGISVNSKESSSMSPSAGYLTQDPRGFLGSSSARIQYGSKNTVQPTNWGQFMIDRQATTQSFQISEVAFAQLSGSGGNPINGVWAGGSMNQISAAVLMFFGVIASTLVLFVYGFALLIYQLMMVTAVILSPFFFLFGIVPNWGRRVLMRYAEILTSLAVKRIITSLLLAVYFNFYQLIIAGANPLSLFLQLIMIAVLAVFAVVARGRFVNLFAGNINFGGNKDIGLPGGKLAAVGAGVAGAGLGLAVAGPLGALLGGGKANSSMRKGNKDLEGDMKNLSLQGDPTAAVKKSGPGANMGNGAPSGGPKYTSPTASTQPPEKSTMKKVGDVARVGKDVFDATEKTKKVVDKVSSAKKPSTSTGKSTTSGKPTTGTPTTNGTPASSTPPSTSTPSGPRVTPTPNATPTGTPFPAGSGAGNVATGAAKTAGGAAKTAAGSAGNVAGGAAQAAGTTAGSAASTAAGTTAGAATVSAAPTVMAAGAAAGTGTAAAGGAAAAGGTATAAAGTAAAAGGTAAAGGAAAGVAGGAAAGAAAGSVVPVAGTIAGAAIGVTAAAIKAKHSQKKAEEAEEGQEG